MPTLEEMAVKPRSGLTLDQMATTQREPGTSEFDNFDDEQKARIRNALLYSGMSNRLPSEVYDYTSGINQQIYGSTDEVTTWKKNIGIIKQTKSWGQAIEHGLIVAGNQMNKSMKDAGWMVADVDQKFWNWVGVRQPEILKRWDEEAFELKREMDAYLEMFYKEHPEQLAETAPETGYLKKALWYTENPKVVVQNTIQSAPIMLLGGLGKVAGLGKAAIIALFGGPTAAETYTQARAEGTEVTPALAQSLLTGAGEGAIEEWTFGRKIGIAQNFSKIVKGGWPKIAWEALKAYGRGAAEETGQQANRNFWQFIFTDGNQKISEGVADAAAAGGPVELLMAGVFGMGGYTIQKTGELVDQAEQHRRLNIIEGEIQKSQNFTDAQKAEITQEIDSVREDVDSGVYLPEETEERPARAPSEVQAKITPISEPKTGMEIPEVAEQVSVAEEEEEPTRPPSPPLEIEKDIQEPEMPSVYSPRNAVIADHRKKLGLDEIASPTRKARKESEAEAVRQGIPEKALRLAAELNENPRALTDVEHAGLFIKSVQLEEEARPIQEKLAKATTDAEVQSLIGELGPIQAEYDAITEALTKSGGTEVARSLSYRNRLVVLNRDTFEFIPVVSRAMASKGKKLTTQENKRFAEQTEKMREMTEEIENLKKRIDEMTAEKTIVRRTLKRYGQMSLEQKDTELMRNAERIRELIKQGCY